MVNVQGTLDVTRHPIIPTMMHSMKDNLDRLEIGKTKQAQALVSDSIAAQLSVYI